MCLFQPPDTCLVCQLHPFFLEVVRRSRVILCDWEMEIDVWDVSDSFPVWSGSGNITWSSFNVPLSCTYSCCFMRVFTVLEKCPCLSGSWLRKDIRRFVCLYVLFVHFFTYPIDLSL